MRRATTKGFQQTGRLLSGQIRRASEAKGFAQSKLLTNWAEIAGAEMAAVSRPVDISYGRRGFGATLTLLTTGAQAPMLEMQKEKLRSKVNAVYGYNAIARVRITQTAATGFAEGAVEFQSHEPERRQEPVTTVQARDVAAPVQDDGLRLALERLGTHILTKPTART